MALAKMTSNGRSGKMANLHFKLQTDPLHFQHMVQCISLDYIDR